MRDLLKKLPPIYHREPQPPFTIPLEHLAPMLDPVMYRLIHGYNLIDQVLTQENLKREAPMERGLNIGSYTAFAEHWLRKQVSQLESIDIDLGMLANHGLPTTQSFPDNNVNLACMDVRNLAFPDETFDVAFFIEIAGTSKTTDFQFVVDALRSTHRVLKPGGSLFLNVKSITGEEKLTKHPDYPQIEPLLQDAFDTFRGTPIRRESLQNELRAEFEVRQTWGQGFINNTLAHTFGNAVERKGIQWLENSIIPRPMEDIDFETEYPMYWLMHLEKI